jgi:hypothetical protein
MSKLYVVLFAGCMNADPDNLRPRYAYDLQRYGDFFSQANGVDAGTLTVLHSDGSQSFQFTNIQSPNVIPGTSAILLATLQSIASAAATTDRLVFVASNHGGKNGTVAYLWGWGEVQITAPTFAQACNGIACRRQAYIFGQCKSGGFIPAVASASRVILTGADQNGDTYPTSDGGYDEFLLRVVEQLEKGEQQFAAVFAAAKAADATSDTPQLSDPGGVGSDASLIAGP